MPNPQARRELEFGFADIYPLPPERFVHFNPMHVARDPAPPAVARGVLVSTRPIASSTSRDTNATPNILGEQNNATHDQLPRQ